MSDQLDPGQEEGEDVKEGEEKEKKVEHRVPATTMAPASLHVPVAKKKYPVVLPYVRGISEYLKRVFRSFKILALYSNYWYSLRIRWRRKGKVVGPVYYM